MASMRSAHGHLVAGQPVANSLPTLQTDVVVSGMSQTCCDRVLLLHGWQAAANGRGGLDANDPAWQLMQGSRSAGLAEPALTSGASMPSCSHMVSHAVSYEWSRNS